MHSISRVFKITSVPYIKAFPGAFALVLILLFPDVLFSQQPRLKSVTIAGNDSLSVSFLREQMVSRPSGFINRILFWKKRNLFSQEILDQDILRLERLYQSEGFLQSSIQHLIETEDGDKEAKVFINISEGRPVIVNNITVEISAPDSATKSRAQSTLERLQKQFQLVPGKRFRDQALAIDEKNIINGLVADGFPYARLVTDLNVNSEKTAVEVCYRISTGLRCALGNVEIKGSQRIKSDYILRQITFKPGQIYSVEKLEKSQERVFQLGVFNIVTVSAVLQDSLRSSVPVEVNVNEISSWSARLGIGYGKEDEFRSFVEVRKNGLWGSPRRVILFLKHSALEPYNMNAKWIRPAFIFPEASLTLNPFVRREKEPGYTVDRIGSNVTYFQQMAKFTEGYVSYALEQDNLKINEQTRLEGLGGEDISLYNKSSLTLGMAKDSSMPPFSPTGGVYSAASVTYSGIGFKSDYRFIRAQAEFRTYKKLGASTVLAARARVGAMRPIRGDSFTPIEERFYSGGSYSVRGWARSQLGPRSSEGVPIGGNSMVESSVELRYPLWRLLSGVLFVDAGNVWPRIGLRLSGLEYALGCGLRFKTAVGPIRLDVAKPVSDKDLPFQFHISIGQAF